MNKLFNLIQQNKDCSFTNEIKNSDYVEHVEHVKTTNKIESDSSIFKNKYNNFVFCILDNNDIILSNSPKSEKSHILNKRVLELLTIIDCEDFYTKFGYDNKIVKKQDIQTSVQLSLKGDNNILTTYFFNDYYKIHFVIVDFHTKKYYETTPKNYIKNYLVIKDKKYYLFTDFDLSDYCLSDLDLLKQFKKDNIKNNSKNIYKSHLDSIGKYKINDLREISKELDIDLKDKGKFKTKAILYKEINSYYLNLI
tara:strand:- start:775 stop:1530 length:756 start_codon:yes stop_codon:yes gene_type:complete